jgi:hypothetical protein
LSPSLKQGKENRSCGVTAIALSGRNTRLASANIKNALAPAPAAGRDRDHGKEQRGRHYEKPLRRQDWQSEILPDHAALATAKVSFLPPSLKTMMLKSSTVTASAL